MAAHQLKIAIVWAVLCLTTVISAAASGGAPSLGVSIAVLGAACAKVYLVMHVFMELDAAPLAWRAAFAGWTVGLFLLLAGLLAYA